MSNETHSILERDRSVSISSEKDSRQPRELTPYPLHYHFLTISLISFQAALWENAELLEDLLEGDQIAHINSQDSWGRTPLHTAAMRESGCLRVLLQAGGKLFLSFCYFFVFLFSRQLSK